MAYWIVGLGAVGHIISPPFRSAAAAEREMRREARYWRGRSAMTVAADDVTEAAAACPEDGIVFACDFSARTLARASG